MSEIRAAKPLPVVPPSEKRARVFYFQYRIAPYLFTLPFLLTFAVFGIYPLVKSLILAFYATNGPKSAVFVGMGNFQFLFADADFQKAARNTVAYAFWMVCLQVPCSLGLALLVNRARLRGRDFFRWAIFAPTLLGSVFVAVLFQVLFVPRYGLLNRALHFLIGLPLETNFLSEPALILPAVVLTSLWMSVGFNMVYFLAALQAVDKTLYEAALVDGANGWQRFLAVTLPGIRPVALLVLITTTIGSFQLFELPYVLLGNGSGPDKAGLTLVMYLYSTGFVSGDLGYASAVGWTLALSILLISLAQARLSGATRTEETEA